MANTAGKRNNQSKSKTQQAKAPAKDKAQQPQTPPKDVKLGDGVGNTIKDEINKQMKEWAKTGLNWVFDLIEAKVKDLPEAIKKLRNNPETEEAFAKKWADHLIENNLISISNHGLPDDLIVDNLKQAGYRDGLLMGFMLTAMAMVDKGIPEDKIMSVRDAVVRDMIGSYYKDMDKIDDRFGDEKYYWILPKFKDAKQFSKKE